MAARSYFVPGIGNLTVGIDNIARLRLSDTCFRREHAPLAGNFLLWRDYEAMLNDRLFIGRFLDAMPAAIGSIAGQRDRKKYISVQHAHAVGWASTAPLDDFDPSELEPFALNARCTGLRVTAESGRLAPLTDIVTFSGDFMRIGETWSVVIYTVYPGPCVGQLEGAISAKTQQAFFAFNHPGVLPEL